MRRLLLATAALVVIRLAGPSGTLSASAGDACGRSCKRDSDCGSSVTELCGYCRGEAVVAGGKGKCQGYYGGPQT